MQSTNPILVMFLLSLTLLLGGSPALAAPSKAPSSNTDFIKAACDATLYRKLCVQSLSVYANAIQQNPRKLAQTALSVSLASTSSASAFVSKLSHTKGIKLGDLAAVKDCVGNIRDSSDRLKQSIRELGQVGRPGTERFQWRMSNVQTWVSAALTDQNTCTDGLTVPGISSDVKASIKRKLVNVMQLTSIGLALVNRFANGST